MATTEQAVADLTSVVLTIIQALVDDVDEVQVNPIAKANGVTLLRVRIAHNDIGKVIGKQGSTARSLRIILGAASRKYKERFILDIDDHEIAE